MIGIYAIFRKSDDKCMYVGQSKNVERRLYLHFYKNSRFNYDEYYNKIIETFDFYDKENQLNREAYWINELNPELNEIRNRHQSLRLKKNQSDKLKGKPSWNKGLTKEDPRVANYAKKHSIAMQGKYIGRKLSEEDKANKSKAAKEYHKLHPKCWMNNGDIQTLVLLEKVQEYLDKGWIKGRLK